VSVTPLKDAEIVTFVFADTALVWMAPLKNQHTAPCGTVTVPPGTLATDGSLLDMESTAPPEGTCTFMQTRA